MAAATLSYHYSVKWWDAIAPQVTDPTLAMLQTMAFPVVSLVRFWANHHLLDLAQRPVWRVVKGRSRQYVQKIVAGMDHLSWQLVN